MSFPTCQKVCGLKCQESGYEPEKAKSKWRKEICLPLPSARSRVVTTHHCMMAKDAATRTRNINAIIVLKSQIPTVSPRHHWSSRLTKTLKMAMDRMFMKSLTHLLLVSITEEGPLATFKSKTFKKNWLFLSHRKLLLIEAYMINILFWSLCIFQQSSTFVVIYFEMEICLSGLVDWHHFIDIFLDFFLPGLGLSD